MLLGGVGGETNSFGTEAIIGINGTTGIHALPKIASATKIAISRIFVFHCNTNSALCGPVTTTITGVPLAGLTRLTESPTAPCDCAWSSARNRTGPFFTITVTISPGRTAIGRVIAF